MAGLPPALGVTPAVWAQRRVPEPSGASVEEESDRGIRSVRYALRLLHKEIRETGKKKKKE